MSAFLKVKYMKKIVIANDHAAVSMKFIIKEYVESLGYEVINVGIDENTSCDYPDYAYKACNMILSGEAESGILICGTGIGMSITANKIKGIRACACSETFSARMSREHNNANVLCFGERVVGTEVAKDIVKEFLTSNFAGGKHATRVQKMIDIEEGNYKI